MTYTKEAIAANIRAERARKDYSLDELSSLTGIHPQTLRLYENGDSMPGYDKACKIADALCVSLDKLAGRD